MEWTGNLLKMKTEIGKPVQYFLQLSDNEINLNNFLGVNILIEYLKEIRCLNCGRATSRSFGQGYCYPCFISIPETSECVLKPELCQAHLGLSRDMEWSRNHCLQDHYVYLALTSAVKVGVTRASQIPTRWIDQGAWKAIRIALAPNRYLAGTIEVELKKHFTDKTNWRHMLTNQMALEADLVSEKHRILAFLPETMRAYAFPDDDITTLEFPVIGYPKKVNSITLDKQAIIEGMLMGIRGQYLIFEGGAVINIRSHGGYKVKITC